jgi:3'-phosphoadenosine 5'-phosphosulfate sulfotransferase (PAPS reductase)/FAD synthetase
MYILVNNNVLERNSSYNKSLFLSNAFLQFYEEGIDDSVIIQGITLSITNTQTQKNMFTDKGVLSKEMINEIKALRLNSTIYLRMDVKVGRKRKSVWTRFIMKV